MLSPGRQVRSLAHRVARILQSLIEAQPQFSPHARTYSMRHVPTSSGNRTHPPHKQGAHVSGRRLQPISTGNNRKHWETPRVCPRSSSRAVTVRQESTCAGNVQVAGGYRRVDSEVSRAFLSYKQDAFSIQLSLQRVAIVTARFMGILECGMLNLRKERCEGKINHLASLGLTLAAPGFSQGMRGLRRVDVRCAAGCVELSDGERLQHL